MLAIFRKITGEASRSSAIPCFCAALLFLIFCANGPAFAKKSDEYTVKAAFILNFAKFSQWPEEAFDEGSGDSLTLCVVGEKNLREYFKTIEGKKIGNRILHIRYMEEDEDCVECHILFISEEVAPSSLDKIFTSIQGKPVLTIGEMKNFANDGGMINFVSKGKKLRFEVNRKTADQQKIKLSSRLLKLAIIVNGNE